MNNESCHRMQWQFGFGFVLPHLAELGEADLPVVIGIYLFDQIAACLVCDVLAESLEGLAKLPLRNVPASILVKRRERVLHKLVPVPRDTCLHQGLIRQG